MNVHDSERLAGLLETAGYVDVNSLPATARPEAADVVVFNTCAVRENADNKLYGNLGQLRPAKTRNPDMQIAVGGCMAQKDRSTIVQRAPWVDVVFGTNNIGSLPALLDRARHNKRAEVEILESLEVFPSTLPTRRDSAYAGWVSISVGCNNTCTFCIVPSLRGKEADRRPGDVLAEIKALVEQGVVEVTLLGQNVNTYGVEFGDRLAFGKLLRACGEIDGLERVRFTSPHPAAFTDDVIAAMAETPNVMPSLHMPLQSGSDRVLKAMRRSYRSAKFLGIIDRVRDADPRRRDHDRHHRRLPGRDRGGLRGDAAGGARVAVRQRVHLPVLHPRRARRPRRCRTSCPRPSCRSATSGCSRCRRRSPGPRTAASRAATSRCSSPPARAARTPRPTACPAAPATTGWCTSPCPTAPSGPAPATWSPSVSPTARRTTSSPTRRSTAAPYAVRRTAGGDAWAALQDAPVPGKPGVSLGMPGVGPTRARRRPVLWSTFPTP